MTHKAWIVIDPTSSIFLFPTTSPSVLNASGYVIRMVSYDRLDSYIQRPHSGINTVNSNGLKEQLNNGESGV
ncbi:hypothetical protein ACWGJQ_00545 [Peribacillus simplex]